MFSFLVHTARLGCENSLEERIGDRYVACPTNHPDHGILVYRETIRVQGHHVAAGMWPPVEVLRVEAYLLLHRDEAGRHGHFCRVLDVPVESRTYLPFRGWHLFVTHASDG